MHGLAALVLGSAGAAVTVVLARAAVRAPGRRRVGQLGPPRPLVPPRLAAPLGAALARADLTVTPDDAVRILAVGTLVVMLLAASLSPVLALPAGAGVVVAAVAGVRLGRGRGDRRVGAAVPAGLDRVASGLRSGGTVGESLGHLASAGGPLAPDLRRLVARTRLGAGIVDALEQWPRERPVPAVRVAAGALAVAAGVGGPSAAALESLAESLRAGAAAIGDAQAMSAQARVSALVVGAAPLAYLAFAAAVDPSSLGVLVGTGAGRLCLAGGLLLELLAALWMRALLERVR
jgi:tight adherence protein B